MESNMVYNVNIMEVLEKEDVRKEARKKIPFIDRNLWLEALERLAETRSEAYPTLAICLGCGEACPQVQVVGLERFYCGIKNKEWRK